MQEAGSKVRRTLLIGVVVLALASGNTASAETSTSKDTATIQPARTCWIFCW